ncbi:hypothetical protein EUTSA_v10026592mg [Eutrema salsugineum]|uniref:Uncharacterized protein n=1 Tax=Eutrema salsugineum TaxID=72664 RepID=V4P9D8_EUTSA|nr:protein RALF-like 32 [Eutrema salsugineum]ESQ56276.1 hypothetical protein EUTSA_v10026592mg [Eutrema salsugineum]
MEYYTFSQGFTENDEKRAPGKHHVKNTWVKERYESDEEDGSRDEEVNKMILKHDDVETKDMVTSSSGERMMLTSKVRYLTYGALKHDTPPAGGGGGRVMPPPSNRYHVGHPKYYRCRG